QYQKSSSTTAQNQQYRNSSPTAQNHRGFPRWLVDIRRQFVIKVEDLSSSGFTANFSLQNQ
ncbi:hypothetical protein CCACVL1_07327, partial [Corchorus capsularis]